MLKVHVVTFTAFYLCVTVFFANVLCLHAEKVACNMLSVSYYKTDKK